MLKKLSDTQVQDWLKKNLPQFANVPPLQLSEESRIFVEKIVTSWKMGPLPIPKEIYKKYEALMKSGKSFADSDKKERYIRQHYGIYIDYGYFVIV